MPRAACGRVPPHCNSKTDPATIYFAQIKKKDSAMKEKSDPKPETPDLTKDAPMSGPISSKNQEVLREDKSEPSEKHTNITVNLPPNTTRGIEWLQTIINGGLAVIGVIAICIYGSQLQQMKIATKAAKDSATAALLSAEALRPSLAIAFLTPAPITANGFPMDNGRLHVNFQIPNY